MMTLGHPLRPFAVAFVAAAAGFAAVPAWAADPGRGPAAPAAANGAPAAASARDPNAIAKDLIGAMQRTGRLLTSAVLADPAKRAQAAPTAVPLLNKQLTLLAEFDKSRHLPVSVNALARQTIKSQLYLLGDKPTVDATDAAGPNDLAAQAIKLRAQWAGAGDDEAAQKPIVEQVQKLDAAHPESVELTHATYAMSVSAASDEVRSSLSKTIAEQMKNLAAKQYARQQQQEASQQQAMNEAEAKQKALVGKPLVVSGPTVDGKTFSSEQYKGKVVLVDFWATWCGPCLAGLPEVKATYAKYHPQGLEIIGVSNDQSGEKLASFVKAKNMPWVELFDAAAAAKGWNPITTGYGVMSIPTMFLIDKKGICRSITARRDMQTEIPKLLAE